MSVIVSEIKSQSAGQQRNHFLDTLKGFAILGVVCVHFGGSFATSANAWTPSFYTGLALNQFFHFAVPLFIFISGLLASPYRSHRQIGFGRYYLERILVIGWPYLIASVAAFFLLGVGHELTALPTDAERARWLLSRLLYYGVHPTFYFIPMILLLYFLKPFLSWLAPALHRQVVRRWNSAISLRTVMLAILATLLAAHVILGFLGYRGVLDFYTWCRPNPLFWAVYFYFGLVFPEIAEVISPERIKGWLSLGIILIVVGYFLDWKALTDISVVGPNFEHSKVNYAYARPEILVLNLVIILVVAGLLVKETNKYNAILSFLGKHSLQIYLWHILVLYFLAWRYESVLNTVKSAPELIVGFAFFTSIMIAAASTALSFLLNLPGRYSVEIKASRI
ncbi:Surface polysaccharide O-acyltransferase, integral membrane enzyme [Candidatus Nitrotoga sp. HW29]|uniref:acyltransferase n=1 Tax=Candidatus Nitrotoga sp. HW29 TaxID=2886963 RepID=UPI001EF207D3|nr:acyltransferase family protein [Candidatus Nitrotoga sp. HW29]CAH1904837.1 Surface polysaccharide O-acyltransferase, integral membrane enzyme [Candidatus Nitrotoga sp. HW29]